MRSRQDGAFCDPSMSSEMGDQRILWKLAGTEPGVQSVAANILPKTGRKELTKHLRLPHDLHTYAVANACPHTHTILKNQYFFLRTKLIPSSSRLFKCHCPVVLVPPILFIWKVLHLICYLLSFTSMLSYGFAIFLYLKLL